MKHGTRVLILSPHPAKNSTGTVVDEFEAPKLIGGGTRYVVEVDSMGGHRVGCERKVLRALEEP